MDATSESPTPGGPRLVVVTGRPGTGKTTLSSALARKLGACYLRIDAIETAVEVAVADFGIGDLGRAVLGDVGPVGYVVAHQLAASNLGLGCDVVVDAVCPVPESRVGWTELAAAADGRLIMIETALPDRGEHRRRVERREPDMPRQHVPTWDDVVTGEWVAWDLVRDGPRTLIDTTDAGAALRRALALLADGTD